MFSLIITIISIALVAALAVASVYYGGAQFSQGTAKAQAAPLVSQAQQIAGANTLYANDNGGTLATDVEADLVAGGYLSGVPAVNDKVRATGAQWTLSGRMVLLDLNDNATEVAAKVDEQAGFSGTRPADVSEAEAAAHQFGIIDDNGDLMFFYKG